jgi:Flp pilus assembly protein TadD
MQKAPNDPQPAFLLGTIEEGRNDWRKAQDYYQKALQIRPEYPAAANNLAYSMLIHGGNSDVALSLAQTACRAMPNQPTFADTLALAYIRKQSFSTAINVLQEAIKKSPPNATYEYHLGLAYQQTGNVANARKHLNKALSINPTFPDAVETRKALQDLGQS